jgi:hypothetical protein
MLVFSEYIAMSTADDTMEKKRFQEALPISGLRKGVPESACRESEDMPYSF